MDGIPTGTTTQVHNEPQSNGNEGILHTPQTFRTEASPLDSV